MTLQETIRQILFNDSVENLKLLLNGKKGFSVTEVAAELCKTEKNDFINIVLNDGGKAAALDLLMDLPDFVNLITRDTFLGVCSYYTGFSLARIMLEKAPDKCVAYIMDPGFHNELVCNAVRSRNVEFVAYLFEKYPNLLDYEIKDGFPILLQIVKTDNAAMLDLLIQIMPDIVNIPSATAMAAFDLVVKDGSSLELLDCLLLNFKTISNNEAALNAALIPIGKTYHAELKYRLLLIPSVFRYFIQNQTFDVKPEFNSGVRALEYIYAIKFWYKKIHYNVTPPIEIDLNYVNKLFVGEFFGGTFNPEILGMAALLYLNNYKDAKFEECCVALLFVAIRETKFDQVLYKCMSASIDRVVEIFNRYVNNDGANQLFAALRRDLAFQDLDYGVCQDFALFVKRMLEHDDTSLAVQYKFVDIILDRKELATRDLLYIPRVLELLLVTSPIKALLLIDKLQALYDKCDGWRKAEVQPQIVDRICLLLPILKNATADMVSNADNVQYVDKLRLLEIWVKDKPGYFDPAVNFNASLQNLTRGPR